MTAAADMAICFRPVTAADLPLLADWIARPHWQDWWGEPEAELGYVRDMIAGIDTTCRPFIMELDGEPLGYIQAWQVGCEQTPESAVDSPWLMALPADAIGIDLSIADASQLSRGIGSAAIRRFVAMLREEGHRHFIIDPDAANTRAVAAYRKAGFRPVPALEGRTEGVLIMQYQQDSSSK